jgi:hypothetical protein
MPRWGAVRRALLARRLHPAQQYAASARRHSGTGSRHHWHTQPLRFRFTSMRLARSLRWVRPDSMNISIDSDQPPPGSSAIDTPDGSGAGIGTPFRGLQRGQRFGTVHLPVNMGQPSYPTTLNRFAASDGHLDRLGCLKKSGIGVVRVVVGQVFRRFV